MKMASVGQLIVESLVSNGIDRLFCVPGESYLGLLDALYGRDDIDPVVCRHEAGAGFMALADARLTGRPAVAAVSRGPGASNAAIAVHTAQQDGVPFILIVGQVAANDVRRDSFQEIDYGHMFGSIAKWTAEVTDPARMAETILRAVQVATAGVPGPVVISVPEDVLTSVTHSRPVGPQAPIKAAPDAADAAALREWLRTADRPLVVAGSNLDRPGGREALRKFIEAWNIPLMVSFRRHDLFANAHRLYAGDLGLANPASQMAVLRDADLVLVLGARLSDITTQGYSFPHLVRPEMKLVHVHPDPSVIGTHFAVDLAIACDSRALIEAVGSPSPSSPRNVRDAWIERLAVERRKIAAPRSIEVDDGICFEDLVDIVGRSLSDDAIVTLDAGTFSAPVYRIVPFSPPQRLLAPISGAMGFGVPAAVAASLREPGRQVICFVGDGGFLMTGHELSVAMERKLPLKVILSENGIYGSIRIHQERDYPGRTVGTSFTNPDFELIGEAFGFHVTRMRSRSDLSALPSLLSAAGPELILVETSVEAILPGKGGDSRP
ncbi:thiamine pyrophosphate-binding protein [Aurantimonas sp. C2-6-R+9]|uniref:thiamine pyrophosphate-binding protein n=1 Tax=unclassified Aurantimonas TaxID=2638230 RepID=UPI002E17448C|nr:MULTISPECIES: thiamine pyrophosphate-binding protein [unclassified Aurantimonas]MEC5293146.1 thiamine pyrophosphate-binding protein [Aurantimonas sp. C2-3-R2]MEC5324844.1 thiamine pyrophosphate-binding protein [Aurantimonas sp. A3-2-R12]MEC5383267.1 thiamine pyrophosphate-binding protein [Aurantimonas sp. C2-6-R+9]MEC5414224.1 thiamine pyrophosphate-binding protein [Aurantimonas sp. C2-4-R8]